MSYFSHRLVQLNAKKNFRYFHDNLKTLRTIQLQKISNSYHDFINEHPLSTYDDYADFCKAEMHHGIQCIPTSGSTQKIKWIPYHPLFKKELSCAIHPWIYQLYEDHPEIRSGKHFWSMSWVPDELRHTHTSDDLSFFNMFEKIILKNVMVLPSSVSLCPTLSESLMLTLKFLLEEKVTLISIWSPTFFLELLAMLLEKKDEIAMGINSRKLKNIVKSISSIDPDMTRAIFPHLKVLSSWDTSTSKVPAMALKSLFPWAFFQGKGLFATEGVVSIPFRESFILSYTSHFYEFQCIDTNVIFPSYEVPENFIGKVIITTANGFKRYQLNDIVQIAGFHHSVPLVKFLGRERTIDLVGEKFSFEFFRDLIDQVQVRFQFSILTFIAFLSPHPFYAVLIDGHGTSEDEASLEAFIENEMMKHFHYKLARELNQIHKSKVIFSLKALGIYMEIASENIMIKGNVKIEPAVQTKKNFNELHLIGGA